MLYLENTYCSSIPRGSTKMPMTTPNTPATRKQKCFLRHSERQSAEDFDGLGHRSSPFFPHLHFHGTQILWHQMMGVTRRLALASGTWEDSVLILVWALRGTHFCALVSKHHHEKKMPKTECCFQKHSDARANWATSRSCKPSPVEHKPDSQTPDNPKMH